MVLCAVCSPAFTCRTRLRELDLRAGDTRTGPANRLADMIVRLGVNHQSRAIGIEQVELSGLLAKREVGDEKFRIRPAIFGRIDIGNVTQVGRILVEQAVNGSLGGSGREARAFGTQADLLDLDEGEA